MPRAFACITLCALLTAGAAFPAAFEAADVHVSAKSQNAYMTTLFRGGRYELRKATMLDLIRIAYGVDPYKIIGGPGWLELDRFDVIAKAPANSTQDALHDMLKDLLADRFKLAVHNDTKPIPTFFLTVGKGGKKNMKESADTDAPGGCQFLATTPEPGTISSDNLTCKNATMQRFIDELRYPASPYLGVGPVIEKTGLEGHWDFSIRWTRRALLAQAGSDGLTIFDAVDKQLGLKLESQNAPTPVIVVDHVNEKPSENPANVTQRLPAVPAAPKEFEVADIKPTRLGQGGESRIEPNGRVELRGITLQNLITLGWNVDPDMLVGAPKWLNTDRFDVLAKAPVETFTPSAGNPKEVDFEQVDFETIEAMMRALLAERFKLAVHNDVQPVSVYALLAPKRETKMKKADEMNRASCKYSPELLTAGTPLTNIYSCQNTTMAEMAEKLRGWAPAYFDRPVVDLTGIEERFDFSLGWTGKGRLTGPARGGDTGQPSDPTGGITVFEAVERQLGLKLEAQKHPMPVLVIDHVEQKPTDN